MDKREFLAAGLAATMPQPGATGPVVFGITPSSTGAQGASVLSLGLNVLSKTPHPGYSVTLPPAGGSGQSTEVITRSLEFIVIFPPIGGRISFFEPNIGYAIYPGTALTFRDTGANQWDMIYNVASNYPVLNGLVARGNGGADKATRLCYGSNVIATCVTAGDSVILPVALGAGEQCFITNHGNTSCDIFPPVATRINSLPQGAPYALPAGRAALFVDIGPPNQWDGGLLG